MQDKIREQPQRAVIFHECEVLCTEGFLQRKAAIRRRDSTGWEVSLNFLQKRAREVKAQSASCTRLRHRVSSSLGSPIGSIPVPANNHHLRWRTGAVIQGA